MPKIGKTGEVTRMVKWARIIKLPRKSKMARTPESLKWPD